MCSLVFFCSSRRRHTRCLSDWSSDVCSSDLLESVAGAAGLVKAADGTPDTVRLATAHAVHRLEQSLTIEPLRKTTLIERSEERRVGKECRARRGSVQEQSKTMRDRASRRR